MLQVRTCVIVHCDQCGDGCWDGRDYEPHWPTEDAAIAELVLQPWIVIFGVSFADAGRPPHDHPRL